LGFLSKKRRADAISEIEITEYPVIATPQKTVIIAGPAFGEAMKFVLLGVVVGAGAAYYALGTRRTSSASAAVDAVTEGLSGGGAKPTSPQNVVDRLSALSGRLKTVASHARETVETVSDAVKPALEHAVAEGKKAASSTQTDLESDLKNAKAEAEKAATIADEAA
jgi:hypothetical protein